MSRWFRHYAGMMRDEKLVAVAVKAKQPVERVLWVWGAILESAAEINDGGRYDLDTYEVAYFLRADEADISAIINGLSDAKRLASGFVVNWRDRQFESDRSANRQANYRARQKDKNSNVINGRASESDGSAAFNGVTLTHSDGGVTSRDGGVTPPETDTDTEKKKDKPNGLSKKGCRLPDDWLPKHDDWFPARERLGYERAQAELDKFKDYWRSIPGQKGVKLDWDATWRNWVRKAAEQQPRGQPPPKQKYTYVDAMNEILEEMGHERQKSEISHGNVERLALDVRRTETSADDVFGGS